MSKFVCTVCGYVYEGDAAPEFCPVCKAPASKFVEQKGEMTWAAEHVVGVAKGVDPEIIEGLRMNFNGECSEVGMYLAMARVAHREGYPEIGLYWEKAAYEEAEHAAKFAELLGEVLTDSTKKNLEMRVEAENGATAGKMDLAKRPRSWGWTPSMTPCMRWPVMRPAMAKRLPVCWPVTSNKISTEQAAENSAACFSSLSQQRDIPIAEAGYMMGKTTVQAVKRNDADGRGILFTQTSRAPRAPRYGDRQPARFARLR